MPFRLAAAAVLSLAAALSLAGCAGDGGPMPGLAAGPPKPPPAPDFVAQSRPANLDYLPVGTAVPPRPTPARTAEETRAAEAELDAARARNEAQGATLRRAGGVPARP